MTENRAKWPSKHRKPYKSGHRMAAKGILFPQLWYGGVISTNLKVIWEMSVKIGAKVVSHGRYATFQLAEVAVPKDLFRKILGLIDDLRPRPAPA